MTNHICHDSCAHTVSVGHVHTQTVPGGPCRADCPHPVHAPSSSDEWADVRVGQTWRSRDSRDDNVLVTVIGFTQDRVSIRRHRLSYVRKDRWHKEYELAWPQT